MGKQNNPGAAVTVKNGAPDIGGLVLGWSKNRRKIYSHTDDTHSLIIGSTRCGKSRHVVLPSIGYSALAGESMINVDPKGELYLYSKQCLEKLGYEVIAIDFIEPNKSNHYNFVQPVLDAVNEGDLSRAVTCAQDISTLLVPDKEHTSSDPIWSMGERAIITVAILAVCILFPDPRHQNLSNARHFIAKMCVPGPRGEPAPIVGFLNQLPDDSPMRTALDIAKIAPDKMQCSFYASALTTLSVFADTNIHSMTAMTDFDHLATGDRKRAIFIIVPPEKATYYPIASLFVFQQYQLLVQSAREHGNRLKRRVEFFCDEFGNFAKIPDMDKAITIGGGLGCRFHLFVQDLNQIYERYGERLGKTMVGNCETWIYLHTANPDTVQEIVKKLDKYTIKSPSISSGANGQGSASFNYTARDLLTISEVQKIRRPWQLVMSRADPVVMFAPDISKTFFNTMFGMGSKRHNEKLIEYRNAQRKVYTPSVSYWDGWKKHTA